MPRSNYQSRVLSDFGGPLRNALAARNMRYMFVRTGEGVPRCKPTTRAGHANAFNQGSAAVKSMVNFLATDPTLSALVNRIVFYTGAEVKVYDQVLGLVSSLSPALTASAFKAQIAQASTRCYIALYDVNGIGATQGRVVDTSYNADKLFEPPMLTTNLTLTPADSGTAGSVTAGLHKFALLVTTRTGYTTQPGPMDGTTGVFTPASLTAVGGQKVALTVTPNTWPSAAASIAIVMSPTTDPDTYYFVPGATYAVMGGGSMPGTINIDISDGDLINCVPAIDYFSLLCQNPVTKVGPFSPSFCIPYGNRMVYGAGDRVYISDPFNYQSITADQHVQYLPGLRQITGGFTYRDNNLYLGGPNYTYSLADNGDVPSTWAGPKLIDGKIGIPSPTAATQDPSSDQVLVATLSGLRLFANGSYQDPPLSFWQKPDWDRINWAYGSTIEVLNDLDAQTYRVLAPLDAATAPSHEMTFNYMSGKTPETVRYALNDVPGRYCFAVVQRYSTRRNEVWLGPASAGTQVWRRDESLDQDVGAAIATQVYETQRVLEPEQLGGPAAFHGAHFTADGTAVLRLIGYGANHTRSTPPKDTDLSSLIAGQRVLRQWLLNSENESLEFSAQSGHFTLTEAEPYFTPWVGQR